MNGVLCDWLGATIPAALTAEATASIEDVIYPAGAWQVSENFYRIGEESGGFFLKRRHSVLCIDATGQALASLRTARLFDEYLFALSGFPHRVTRMDAAYDQYLPAAPLVRAAVAAGRAGTVRLTRKWISPTDVEFRDRVAHYDPNIVTGTAYLGSRGSEVRMAVYDKRNERMDAGHADPGDWVRYELRVARVGATLRDASDPEALFWHYAAPTVLPLPERAPRWTANGDGGYELPRRELLLPAQRLRRMVEQSGQLDAIAAHAATLGPEGMTYLWMLLRQRLGLPQTMTSHAAAQDPATAVGGSTAVQPGAAAG